MSERLRETDKFVRPGVNARVYTWMSKVGATY